ncbi:hypothetical protein AVEN_217769-1 [Araneus ventricosus]|uniref:Uncharacterized protein n=1 Tax=Araneus ventricosus TaxID=182803 RepID=A0A4Y2QAV8_ARAVE|nr:hypothetical protein AVEN_217769-1 [Araneus ventricosus]
MVRIKVSTEAECAQRRQLPSIVGLGAFLVAKAVSISVGDVKSTRKLHSGDLLADVSSPKKDKQILKLKSLSIIPISVQPHGTLNSSKGVISVELCNDTVDMFEEIRP